MTTKVTTFSLRLPLSLKAAVEKLAEADGTSMNQFLVMAAAEKLTALRTAAEFFAERKGHGDRDAAIRFLTRAGGEPPRAGDELAGPGTGDGQSRRGGRRCVGAAPAVLCSRTSRGVTHNLPSFLASFMAILSENVVGIIPDQSRVLERDSVLGEIRPCFL